MKKRACILDAQTYIISINNIYVFTYKKERACILDTHSNVHDFYTTYLYVPIQKRERHREKVTES